MELIYCGGSNRRFAQIAIDHGFLFGSQLPRTVYYPLYFADQCWKKPNRAAYMAALAQHRPHMASVLDLERADQLDEVLSWAEEAAQYVQCVMLIPKVFGIIPRLPRRIGGADVRLGYSVPTKFGGTELPVWEFAGWPVHLLGGSPNAQMELAHYMAVESADGNMAMKAATKFCNYWDGIWRDIDATGYTGNDAPYEAFRRSCENIAAAWVKLGRRPAMSRGGEQ
jgi:hypothetical protein